MSALRAHDAGSLAGLSPSSLLRAYNTCLKNIFLLLRKVNRLAPPLNVIKFFGFPGQNSPSPSLPLPAVNERSVPVISMFITIQASLTSVNKM